MRKRLGDFDSTTAVWVYKLGVMRGRGHFGQVFRPSDEQIDRLRDKVGINERALDRLKLLPRR